MAQDFNFKDREEGSNSVQRFEEMLKNQELVFFDLETYESIIDEYVDEGNYQKALKACELALEQYPYST
jgi:tetratricopeptide (TPR) repeat protein